MVCVYRGGFIFCVYCSLGFGEGVVFCKLVILK